MSKKSLVTFGLLFTFGAAMILLPSPVDAKKPYMLAMRKHFTLSPEMGKCVLCHLPAKDPDEDTLNAYGKDIKASDKMKDLLKIKKPTAEQTDPVWQAAESIADQDSD